MAKLEAKAPFSVAYAAGKTRYFEAQFSQQGREQSVQLVAKTASIAADNFIEEQLLFE
jgi:hypothetical protein